MSEIEVIIANMEFDDLLQHDLGELDRQSLSEKLLDVISAPAGDTLSMPGMAHLRWEV